MTSRLYSGTGLIREGDHTALKESIKPKQGRVSLIAHHYMDYRGLCNYSCTIVHENGMRVTSCDPLFKVAHHMQEHNNRCDIEQYCIVDEDYKGWMHGAIDSVKPRWYWSATRWYYHIKFYFKDRKFRKRLA